MVMEARVICHGKMGRMVEMEGRVVKSRSMLAAISRRLKRLLITSTVLSLSAAVVKEVKAATDF